MVVLLLALFYSHLLDVVDGVAEELGEDGFPPGFFCDEGVAEELGCCGSLTGFEFQAAFHQVLELL